MGRGRPRIPDDQRHGSITFYYGDGCRCDECKQAMREYKRKIRGGTIQERIAALTAERDRLAAENERLRALCTYAGVNPEAGK